MLNGSGATSWTLWQLADSAFPAGGLNHSQGLEAAFQSGRVRTGSCLREFCVELMHSQASIALPLVVSAHTDPSNANLATCDADCEASLVANHVARRASIAQGKGLMAALGAAYPQLEMKKLRKEMDPAGGFKGHLAPIMGMSCARLGVAQEDCARLFLFIALRSAISAAVRLGICGPLEGQVIQASVADQVAASSTLSPDAITTQEEALALEDGGSATRTGDAVNGEKQEGKRALALKRKRSDGEVEFFSSKPLDSWANVEREGPDLFNSTPMVDLLQGTQDRLFCKLFSS